MHGFAASCEQWERLAYALRQQAAPEELPPVWAVDMLGFGHTEKPGLSYTQHLWEAQVADFAYPCPCPCPCPYPYPYPYPYFYP